MLVMSTSLTERLPPGQRWVKKWPRLDLGVVPRFDPNTWDLRADGEVDQPLKLGWNEFLALPSQRSNSDFHCVTAWSTSDNEWEGVTVQEIAQRAKVRPSAKFVIFSCGDGYTTSLPLDVLMKPGVLLAYRWDGKPLPLEHGGPMRLLVPTKYGWKSAKWVRQLTFVKDDVLGYWEVRGYSNTADPWTEDRYSF